MGESATLQTWRGKVTIICCGKLEQLIAEGYKFPFYCDGNVWIILLTKKKKSGAHNDKDYKKVLLKFCPFCGENLEQKGCDGD